MRLQLWSAGLLILAQYLASPSPVSAQGLDVGPVLGLYAPLGRFSTSGQQALALPRRPSDLEGLAWGVEGDIWFTSHFGLQLQGSETSRQIGGGVVTPGGSTTSPRNAQALVVEAQVLWRPLGARLPIWFSAGGGVVRHGGDAYAGFGVPTPVAVALGLGLDVRLMQELTVALDVTSLLYSLHVTSSSGQAFEDGFQTDVLAHIGLSWHIGR